MLYNTQQLPKTAFTYNKYCNCLHTQITMLLPMPFIGTSHNSVPKLKNSYELTVHKCIEFLPLVDLLLYTVQCTYTGWTVFSEGEN